MNRHRMDSDEVYEYVLTDDDGALVAGATVTLKILEKALLSSSLVGGETWPKTMSEVSTGVYQATVSDSLDVVEGDVIHGLIVASAGGKTLTERVRITVIMK